MKKVILSLVIVFAVTITSAFSQSWVKNWNYSLSFYWGDESAGSQNEKITYSNNSYTVPSGITSQGKELTMSFSKNGSNITVMLFSFEGSRYKELYVCENAYGSWDENTNSLRVNISNTTLKADGNYSDITLSNISFSVSK